MKIGYGKMKMISGANSCLTFKTKKKMKKILFMVAAVALMAMVSCNKENANDAPQVKEPSVVMEFSASISADEESTDVKPQSSAATRTAVDFTDGPKKPKTLWLKTDEISINGEKFIVKELKNNGQSAVFVNKDVLPADFGAPYTAVYPHAAYADGGDGKITKITLPSTQTAKADKFPEDAVCAAAYSDDAVLKFKNVASVLMFQVAKACETVTISSDNALAGTVSMTPIGDDAVPTFGEGTEMTVTIKGPFAVGEKYYVAVLPGTKANFVVRHDGYLSRNAASVTIARSGFANMGTLPEPKVRLYVQSEKTVFDMNIYAWGIDGVSLPSSWPGESMTWDEEKSMYYYDFPYGIKDKKMNYIVNNGVYQTPDLDATISCPEYEDTKNVNWHWIYFKPSDNWKEGNAWFAAWFNKDGGDEYWMRSIGPENGVYGFVQPTTFTKVEFERMNPASKDMNWSNKWNSTNNLTIPTDEKNYFQCTEGWWNSHNGPWTKYTLPN